MLKRTFDVLLSTVGLIFLAPLFIACAVWIKLDSKGEIFFRQVRVGRDGKEFRIYKFRTMRSNSEGQGRLTVGDDLRISRAGKVLRKYKIDELPQLIDVLIGNMSLVGPRPEVPEFIACYPPDARQKILSVRPGITDLASIELVDENEVLAKFEDPKQAYIDVILPQKQKFYVEYVNRNDLFMDIKIILKTLIRILKR